MSENRPSSFFAAKGAHLQHIVYDRMLQSESIDVVHACVGANVFQEPKNPVLKVAIPFGRASIQATWQSATGSQKQQQVQTGHVSIMPAQMPYETNWQCQAEILILCLQPKLMSSVAEEVVKGDRAEIVEHWTANDVFIQQLGFTMRAELQNGSPSHLYLDALSTVLATHLLRNYSTSQPLALDASEQLSSQVMTEVAEYIHENLALELSLAALAQVAGMNLYRFARAFKRAIGVSPHQYVLQQRIERAKVLLAHTDFAIHDISYQLGFSSQSHFTTAFRQAIGITPKAFREAQ